MLMLVLMLPFSLPAAWAVAEGPTAACAATLDKYCGDESNPDLKVCYASMRKDKQKIPLVAGFSGPPIGSRFWRCYSPDDLAGADPAAQPLLNRSYIKGINYCSNSAQLEALLHKCDPGFTPPPPPPTPPGPTGARPVLVFRGGGIPSLTFVPPSGRDANGTLVAFSEWEGPCPEGSTKSRCSLGAKRSTDLGRSWAPATFPADEATEKPTPGAHSHWCCPQSLYDHASGAVVLQFSNSTSVKGGCDINVEQLGGVLQVKSTDAGRRSVCPLFLQLLGAFVE